MSKPNLHERTVLPDWNDLRTVLAVARNGSLAGAARELELRHSTVFRRIENVERRLGTRLFERSRSGWTPNEQGEAVARAALEMEAAALSAERSISGADARLSGVVRIATSELLATHLLPDLLARFLAAHPAIEVEVDVSNRNVDLTRREADLALRATLTPPDSLVGRQVATIRYAVYASRSVIGRRRTPPVLEELPWIGFDERVAHFHIAAWLREALPQVRPRLRLDSLPSMLRAAVAGVGAVAAPMFAGAQHTQLLRLTPPIEGPEMGLWVLSHPDVRSNARVRALAGFLADAVPAEIARLVDAGGTCTPFAECPLGRRRGRRTARALSSRNAP